LTKWKSNTIAVKVRYNSGRLFLNEAGTAQKFSGGDGPGSSPRYLDDRLTYTSPPESGFLINMQLEKIFFRLALITLLGLTWIWLQSMLTQPASVYAAATTPQPTPTGPDRFTTMKVKYTTYEWWLVGWEDNEINCDFWVEHKGLPTDEDIVLSCGQTYYKEWKKSVPCTQSDIKACRGFYLSQVRTTTAIKDVPIQLPSPEVVVSLENCELDPDGWCTQQPSLVLTGNEPLPNESIVGIYGLAGSDPFTCAGNRCEFTLNETKKDGGLRVQFWAYSTYGDSTEKFEALLRVIKEEGGERLTPRWHVDVLSTQWTGKPAASCAQIWESFPPPEGLPDWLTTPESASALQTSIPFAYLAGNLITQGVVDVSACEDKGLLPNGTASECGLQAAQPAVEQWQNQFDDLILKTSQKTEVPAQLLKNLFSRESQFWPGVFRNGGDVGLGQLTEGGADTALLWNPSFYRQFCPLVLDETLCKAKGYANLKPRHQAILRGALIHSVDGRCDDCPLGLDLSRADFSVEVFARTLLANCEQAGNIVRKVTGQAPGLSVTYEDMWRFTLVNYNAGSGCLAEALQEANTAGIALDWKSVPNKLNKACRGSIGYVNDISKKQESP
jgi:hypothetical protein